jgi:hypothetical protein
VRNRIVRWLVFTYFFLLLFVFRSLLDKSPWFCASPIQNIFMCVKICYCKIFLQNYLYVSAILFAATVWIFSSFILHTLVTTFYISSLTFTVFNFRYSTGSGCSSFYTIIGTSNCFVLISFISLTLFPCKNIEQLFFSYCTLNIKRYQ